MVVTSQGELTIPADEGWLGFGGLHGGLLCAALLAAGTERVPGTPMTVSAHMFAPVQAGPIAVDATVLHAGRVGTVAARIGDSVTGLVRISRIEPGPVNWPPESTEPIDETDPGRLPALELPAQLVPFGGHLDIRPISATPPLAGGDDPGFEVWIRLRPSAFELRAFDRYEAAAILLDALPPGLYATMTRPWPIPTAELTAHFAPGAFEPFDWARLSHRTVWATANLCVDETLLFNRRGELAAQARQLRRILGREGQP